MLKIFALGGNDVSPTGVRDAETGRFVVPDIAAQWQRAALTCGLLASIIGEHPDDSYILTHGNGPQIGNILLRVEYSSSQLHLLPLDVCGGNAQGAMGYMLLQLLTNALAVRSVTKPVAGIITRVEVAADDPDFQNPSKFIGTVYSREDLDTKVDHEGKQFKLYKLGEQGEELWRRVVASPRPLGFPELRAVEKALRAGLVVVAAGGGGIPVVRVRPSSGKSSTSYRCGYGISYSGPRGRTPASVFTGIEAVVDKDLASSLLGVRLLDMLREEHPALEGELTIFTDVDGAKLRYQHPDQVDLRSLTLGEAKRLLLEGAFPPGSMGPKMQAAVDFLEGGGSVVYLSKVELYHETLAGQAGTTILPH